jgi:glycine dehydrogenase subunit 2
MKLLFEKSVEGRRCASLPACDVPSAGASLSKSLKRQAPTGLPELSECDVVRHFIALSRRAHGVDNGFYPLGSCTMKYNPRLNEETAALPGFTDIHPLQPRETVQGCLALMYKLEQSLAEITGMDNMTLQPAAGAHGEWTSLMMIKAYHAHRGDTARTKVIVPDSAHGTNPASASMAGFTVVSVASREDGCVDPEALKAVVGPDTAAFMMTNPNTLGLFEKEIEGIAKIVHSAGGLLYYDGANLNAVMGKARPGDMGFDVVHLNLHKTFSTPHGGGGPGSGAVGCKSILAPFLPTPVVASTQDGYRLDYDRPLSIGQVKNFYGNFLVTVKAYTYIVSLGSAGIKEASEIAVLNANYMLYHLKEVFGLDNPFPCMHEFVLSMEKLKKETGISALDVAKALLDNGIHPPTIYFPLIVHEAMMFEPTETESRETLDEAIGILQTIKNTAYTDPDSLHKAPLTTPVRRLDEVGAARNPRLKY